MSEVTLGGVTVLVVPQKHAYLTHRLGPAITQALQAGEGIAPDKMLEWIGNGVYDALCALIPALGSRMSQWQFMGYGSAEAMASGTYDEAADQSPSILEIKEAITVGMAVNGIDELVKLGKSLIDPRLAKAQINSVIAEAIDSSTSPSRTGDSPSPSTTTTAPTSTESADSPSPASVA